LVASMAPNPMKFIRFGGIHGTNHYKLIGLGRSARSPGPRALLQPLEYCSRALDVRFEKFRARSRGGLCLVGGLREIFVVLLIWPQTL
jgi:hypothetical protein